MNRHPERKELIWGVLLTGLLYLPFLNKAVHIDDPVVLRVTENVLENPLDPFAGGIDWFGSIEPFWKVTTNPPFLSYYLAPFAAVSGGVEVILHLAMLPFVLILILGLLSLGRRFSGSAFWPAIFVAASPAVVVSLNLMRDVPAMAVSVVGIALFVDGIDRDLPRRVALGSLTAGLAVVIKYSAVVLLPLLFLYVLLRGPLRRLLVASGSLLPLAIWSIFSAWRYGQAHPAYLMMGQIPGQGREWGEHSFAAVLIVGCSLLLAPLLARNARPSSEPYAFLLVIAALAAGPLGSLLRLGRIDLQYAIAFSLGTGLLGLVFFHGIRSWWSAASPERADWCFLLFWLLAALASALLLVPFPAVRHLLPALPPLSLLAWKIAMATPSVFQARRLAPGVLLLQAALSMLVAGADAAYAGTYREFARSARRAWTSEGAAVWYVGHWGWKFYADQAGFRAVHGNGEFPAPGDLLLWPKRVHIGGVFRGRREFLERLELLDEQTFDSALPVRTMNFEGAAFYATIRDNLPYRFHRLPLETMRVYRVE